MESHSRVASPDRSNRRAMEEDRLSSLPNDLLHSILRGLPLKQAVRTGALSRRWASHWLRALADSPVLDLTDRDFARGQPPARAAAMVARFLQLHAEQGAPLEAFRVALVSPSGRRGEGGALGRDVIGWVAAVVRRGAREVGVDLAPPPQEGKVDDEAALLELPAELFQARNSLERLALGRISLRAVPLPAAGLAGLRSLSLSHADVTDEALRSLLASCRGLEFLSLRSCSLLAKVSVASERLRALELVGCRAVEELRVTAPTLESFVLYGRTFFPDTTYGDITYGCGYPVDFDLGDTPAMRDAYLSHLGCDDYLDVQHNLAYPYMCHAVALARILTICSIGLLVPKICRLTNSVDTEHSTNIALWNADQLVDAYSWDKSAFRDMPNLEELQLLMGSLDQDDDLEIVSSFFAVVPHPVLRRLFVRLPSDPAHGTRGSAAEWSGENDDDADMTLEDEIVLDQLTFIKIVNFRGAWRELRLLRFFLKRAPVLEQLMLVTPPEGEGAPGDDRLEAIRERVSALQKASTQASLSVCRPNEDDSPNHPHTRFFHESM